MDIKINAIVVGKRCTYRDEKFDGTQKKFKGNDCGESIPDSKKNEKNGCGSGKHAAAIPLAKKYSKEQMDKLAKMTPEEKRTIR